MDFSEEGDEKGFCVVDLDPAAPQGRRLTRFDFHALEARPFVTIETTLVSGDPDPTRSVLRAIAQKGCCRRSGASARNPTTRFGAAPSRGRRPPGPGPRPLYRLHQLGIFRGDPPAPRLAAGEAEGLQPMQALRLYLDNRDIDPNRRERMVQLAQEIVEDEGLGLAPIASRGLTPFTPSDTLSVLRSPMGVSRPPGL